MDLFTVISYLPATGEMRATMIAESPPNLLDMNLSILDNLYILMHYVAVVLLWW
jgi:hypothetical protein